MKKIFFFVILIILLAIFVYPSFRSPGVDCIAGCAAPKGLPFSYSIEYGGGVVPSPGMETNNFEFYFGYLILDIGIWSFAALVLPKIIASIKNRF